jgi:Phycobilisome degradation protein nblA
MLYVSLYPTLTVKEFTMNNPIELTLEQQFSIRSFATQVEQMSHEQAQDFLVQLYEQMVVREATYKELLKHQWGLDSGSTLA